MICILLYHPVIEKMSLLECAFLQGPSELRLAVLHHNFARTHSFFLRCSFASLN